MSIARKLSSVGEKDPAWDLSFAYYDDPFAWDVGTAYTWTTLEITEDTNPYGLFFKPDGLKMYVTGYSGDAVYEYDLSTAWDISTTSFLQSFSVASQDTSPYGLFFKPDGLKMYVVGYSGDAVHEYDLSTAWDISTTSFLQSFSVASQEVGPTGIFFKPDGTKMYVVGSSGDDVNEYDLSTAWDVSTASFVQSFSVSLQESSPSGVSFKPDGTKMFVSGFSGEDVDQYELSTPWDVSTASFTGNWNEPPPPDRLRGHYISPDGANLYVVANLSSFSVTYGIAQFRLGGFDVGNQEGSPEGLFFKPDGTKMYNLGFASDTVNEYDLSTPWDLSTASFERGFSVASQDTSPFGLFFKPDGLKMYVTGQIGECVYEYDLSTAWDSSTASYVQNFVVSSQETDPSAVFFKPDGTKMYVLGFTSDTVHEYDLSTAWDVSTASYLQSFSISSEESSPRGLFFREDGLKMYVTGASGDAAYEYNLSTAWDVSTASFVQSFNVSEQDIAPTGIFFKPDGLKMYVVGFAGEDINTYTLGPQ